VAPGVELQDEKFAHYSTGWTMIHLSPTEVFIWIAVFATLLAADWWVSDLSSSNAGRPDGTRSPLWRRQRGPQPEGFSRLQISTTRDATCQNLVPLSFRTTQCAALDCQHEICCTMLESFDANPVSLQPGVYSLCREHARQVLANSDEDIIAVSTVPAAAGRDHHRPAGDRDPLAPMPGGAAELLGMKPMTLASRISALGLNRKKTN
jgi:hypothetical protein